MNFGMLWFDNNPRKTLAEIIDEASTYYQKKYKLTPNKCFVNPSMLSNEDKNSKKLWIGGVRIESTQTVLPNHIWIGHVEKHEEAKKQMQKSGE